MIDRIKPNAILYINAATQAENERVFKLLDQSSIDFTVAYTASSQILESPSYIDKLVPDIYCVGEDEITKAVAAREEFTRRILEAAEQAFVIDEMSAERKQEEQARRETFRLKRAEAFRRYQHMPPKS